MPVFESTDFAVGRLRRLTGCGGEGRRGEVSSGSESGVGRQGVTNGSFFALVVEPEPVDVKGTVS